MVLSFVLIQNRQGKTRLAKWYSPYNDESKQKLKGEIHRLVAPRDQKHQSNFVEFRGSSKIVYRRYAGLFFCACVDAADNELAYLEAIHFFVEVLDQFFGNVCELDLVFNFYKVYAILDEVFLAGEIQETSKQVVLTRLEHLDKLEKDNGDAQDFEKLEIPSAGAHREASKSMRNLAAEMGPKAEYASKLKATRVRQQLEEEEQQTCDQMERNDADAAKRRLERHSEQWFDGAAEEFGRITQAADAASSHVPAPDTVGVGDVGEDSLLGYFVKSPSPSVYHWTD